MKKFLSLMLVVVMVLVSNVSFAALADVNTSIGADDVYEINNATPGTSKTFLGTRLQGRLVEGASTFAAGDNGNITTNNAAVTPTTKVFLKTTHATISESYYLGNSYPGHTLTAVLVSDGGGNFTITPVTKSGFTSLLLNDANDACTIQYINSTVGWVLVGNSACTIN